METTILKNKRIPLKCVLDDLLFLLLSITEIQEYDESRKPTGRILGYTYEVVDTNNFDKYKVKVKGQLSPLMEPEELKIRRENSEKVAVEFINPTVLLYWDSMSKGFRDSFSADDIKLVESVF